MGKYGGVLFKVRSINDWFSLRFSLSTFYFRIAVSIFKAKAEADTPNEISMPPLAGNFGDIQDHGCSYYVVAYFQYTKSISFIWSSPVFISFVSSMARLTASSSLCPAGGGSRSAMSSVDLEKALFTGTAHRLEVEDIA